MPVVLPRHFPLSLFVRQDKLVRCAGCFEPRVWLTDEAIVFVQSHFQLTSRASLPEDILFVDARTVSLISLGEAAVVQVALPELQLEQRKLVLCPINDSRTGTADSGSHWSLVVAFRSHIDQSWRCVYIDSSVRGKSSDSPSGAKAVITSRRLLGGSVRVDVLPSASQTNGQRR